MKFHHIHQARGNIPLQSATSCKVNSQYVFSKSAPLSCLLPGHVVAEEAVEHQEASPQSEIDELALFPASEDLSSSTQFPQFSFPVLQ